MILSFYNMFISFFFFFFNLIFLSFLSSVLFSSISFPKFLSIVSPYFLLVLFFGAGRAYHAPSQNIVNPFSIRFFFFFVISKLIKREGLHFYSLFLSLFFFFFFFFFFFTLPLISIIFTLSYYFPHFLFFSPIIVHISSLFLIAFMNTLSFFLSFHTLSLSLSPWFSREIPLSFTNFSVSFLPSLSLSLSLSLSNTLKKYIYMFV